MGCIHHWLDEAWHPLAHAHDSLAATQFCPASFFDSCINVRSVKWSLELFPISFFRDHTRQIQDDSASNISDCFTTFFDDHATAIIISLPVSSDYDDRSDERLFSLS